MTSVAATDRNLTLPSSALFHLRRTLRKEMGPLGAVHALHDAGFATGDSLYADLARRAGVDPSGLDAEIFWQELDRLFRDRGLGEVVHQRSHPGLGLLRARACGESDPTSGETQPSCAFTAGILAHLLGRAAAGPVAVLEVTCRSRGDEECGFLFGSETAVYELYGLLLDGASVETALERL